MDARQVQAMLCIGCCLLRCTPSKTERYSDSCLRPKQGHSRACSACDGWQVTQVTVAIEGRRHGLGGIYGETALPTIAAGA